MAPLTAVAAAVAVLAPPAGAAGPGGPSVTPPVASANPLGAFKVNWMPGFRVPGTPARYDRVGVIKVGRPTARNVLVLEPGTSAGSTYFLPLAEWIVARLPSWQVWSVERRENLFEDQSVLTLAKQRRASPIKTFNYYLGWLADQRIKRHIALSRYLKLAYPKRWGMRVAVEDLHRVIRAAAALRGQVVLGGHSLGGAVVTAYATWSFGGRAGADDLAGLVYIDGGARPAATADKARADLAALMTPTASPWLAFGGIGAPFAGLFNATGSTGVVVAPSAPSLGQKFPLLPADLKPSVPVTNVGQYGYALNVGTSPTSLVAAQAHLGRGIAPRAINGYHGWDGRGALTPVTRFATMFSGPEVRGADGTEWYFPARLTLDTEAVGSGLPSPAQRVLGLRATLGRHLPRRLRIYAFAAALGGPPVLLAARLLARQSHIPARNLTLVDRHTTYAHNDPAGAYPHNAFFAHLIPFLRRLG